MEESRALKSSRKIQSLGKIRKREKSKLGKFSLYI